MTDEWLDLITDFFDGHPTEEDARRLNDWIKSDPRNARRFVREVIIHSYLHDLLNGEEAMRQQALRMTMESGETMVLPALSDDDEPDDIDRALPSPPAILPPPPEPTPIYRRRGFKAASIMIPLLLGFAIYQLIPRRPPIVAITPVPAPAVISTPQTTRPPSAPQAAPKPAPPPPPSTFAAITSTVNARWSGASAQLQPGQRLPDAPLFLQSGFAEIKFDTGATMIVEAPARFQVRAGNVVNLASGQIAAKVPTSAHGFAVVTATSRFVDLGTEFGVAASPNGSDDVQVFKGNVRAQAQGASAAPPLLLSAGQAAVTTGKDIKLDDAGAQPQAFVRSLASPPFIDMVDLICGGDGTTRLRDGAIDQRTGESGHLTFRSDAGAVAPDYHSVPRLGVVDGCFVPDGKDIIDSKRQTFDFGASNGKTLYQIRAGELAWPVAGETFTGMLGGIDYSKPEHGLILLHPNAGITFDLLSIRRLHPAKKLADFQAIIGNTCPTAQRSVSAHVFVLVDGISRFDLPNLTHNNGAVNLRVPLADADRFLTIAVMENRSSVSRDWIILGDPRLE